LFVRRGKRIAQDSQRLPSVVEALHFLAQPRRNKPARRRRVDLLLAAWQETSVVETIFYNANDDESEFIRLLELAAGGDETVCLRISEIATAIIPTLSVSRGPKIKAASAAHEFFLEAAAGLYPVGKYTWNHYKEDFTDPITATKRREFDDNDFDHRPACARFKARAADAY
jgi:hypothetical protein